MKRLREIINEIFETGEFTNSTFRGGKYVRLFEHELTQFLGKETITVNSGTSALITALWLAGVRAGDKVSVPAYSFKATKNAVLALQAIPLYVDVKKDTCRMDTSKIKPSKAVIIVDLFGYKAEIPRDFNHPIIRDACQNFSDKIEFTDFTAFSFYPTKRINTMEGGAVVCDYPDAVRWYRNHGYAGLNLRMNEVSACMGYLQMKEGNFMTPVPVKHYDYVLSPPGECPNADRLLKL